MHRSRWGIALAAGVLIGSGITLGVQKFAAPDYTLTSQTYGGSTAHKPLVGKSYTFDSGTLCVSGGYAKITAVRPRKPEGAIKVVGFSIHTSFMEDTTTTLVTAKCKPNSDAGQRLFVDVRADKLPAAANGYIVDYVIDGQKKSTFNTNFGLLCDSDPRDPTKAIYGEIIQKCYD
jgi:hypothetical protein